MLWVKNPEFIKTNAEFFFFFLNLGLGLFFIFNCSLKVEILPLFFNYKIFFIIELLLMKQFKGNDIFLQNEVFL